MKKIYIILSYSGTVPAKIIKTFTHYEYSHVSIALKSDLKIMYSFGRKKVNNPLNGGFIIESKNGEFYKKFNKTYCAILELEITNKQYNRLLKIINRYKRDIEIYKYDMLGLVLRIFNKKLNRENYKVCTEFVASVLEKSEIHKFDNKIVKPVDFMSIPNIKIIYQGKLLNY